VVPRVVENVAKRVANLARRLQRASVIAVVEQWTAATERAVNALRDADLEPLEPARPCLVARRLDDEVQVIRLDDELDDPEVIALRTPDRFADTRDQ
jgi:hypothetical protein